VLDERKMGWVIMDFELKSFEEKINDITEQFMSLLDSNNAVEDPIKTKFDDIANSKIGGISFSDGDQTASNTNINAASYRFDSIGANGTGAGTTDATMPSHAIKFDVNDDLNRRLEELYNSRRVETINESASPVMTFADYGIGGFDTHVATFGGFTNDKYSANEKEDISMNNYNFNVDDDNSIFSFATVPQERALAPKRSFSDVLFMDIPWDTKLDVWGGIKSFLKAEVKFTF
jgi:hypothetical protein